MNRRKFVVLNGWFLGLVVATGGGLVLTGSCNRKPKATGNNLLDDTDAATLNELAEIIIPTTDTPGGKAAKVGEYIVLTHNDCLDEEQQKENKGYWGQLNQRMKTATGKAFGSASVEERVNLLEVLEKEGAQAYTIYKALIVSAYLSSEIGTAVFMKFKLVPGQYNGCTSERPW
jgi:hypothetical protein